LFVIAVGLLCDEHKPWQIRRRGTKEGVEVNLNLNRERGGAGGMKDVEARIIIHDQGILFQRFGAIRAPFREALDSSTKTMFVVHNEHEKFLLHQKCYWSENCSTLKSVRIGLAVDKRVSQLDSSTCVKHVTVRSRTCLVEVDIEAGEADRKYSVVVAAARADYSVVET